MPAKQAISRLWVAAALLLTGCAGGGQGSGGDGPGQEEPMAGQMLRMGGVAFASLHGAAAGALMFVVDPLAPNWRIETRPLSGGRYAIALKMKHFAIGGDGEAHQVFLREAGRIAEERGVREYRIAEFSESIESTVPLARRVARGVIEFR